MKEYDKNDPDINDVDPNDIVLESKDVQSVQTDMLDEEQLKSLENLKVAADPKDISDEEKNFFKVQILDLLKGIGVIVPIQFIPIPFVSTMLLIIMDYSLKSMGIKILPSSFYKNEDEVNDRQV